MIQEFKVENNSFSAEFGNNGGTVINVLMKQGGNQFHGSGWWFGQRSGLDANDFFSNAAGLPRPNHRHNQYGGMISGPIKEGENIFSSSISSARQTFRRYRSARRSPRLPNARVIFHKPTTRTQMEIQSPTSSTTRSLALRAPALPFPGNVISPSRLNPIGLAVASLYPAPNLPGDPLFQTNNFRANTLNSFSGYQLDAKIDHQINSNQRFSVRYSHLSNSDSVPTILGSGDFGDGVNYATSVHNAAIDYVWTVRPNLLLDLRAGLDRVDAPGFTKYPTLQSVGFPNVLAANGLNRMPMINMDDGPYSGLFTQCCVDTAFAHSLYSYTGSLSWVRGPHSIKFGGEQRLFYNNFWQPDSATGTFGFSQVTTANDPLAGDDTAGNPIAGLLIGYGDNNSLITVRPRVADKSVETAFYIQDDWKVNPKLTLNLGLRYEWSNPYTERYNRVQFSDFTGNSGITVPGLPLTSGPLVGTTIFPGSVGRTIGTDRNNFAPRLGVAYAVTPKTVIRAGGGVYYGNNFATNFQYAGPAFSKDEPIRFSLDGYQNQYATLADPFPTGLPPAQGTKYGPSRSGDFRTPVI